MLGIRILLLLGGLLVWWPLLIVWLILTILPHLAPREVVIVENRSRVQPPPILDEDWLSLP